MISMSPAAKPETRRDLAKHRSIGVKSTIVVSCCHGTQQSEFANSIAG
jgi:hypothetical protein